MEGYVTCHEVDPRVRLTTTHNEQVQGGSNADNILADAYVKGLQMGIN